MAQEFPAKMIDVPVLGRNGNEYDAFFQEYDKYNGFLYNQNKALRNIILFGCLPLIALMALGCIYLGTLPKKDFILMQMAEWGEARYVGDVAGVEFVQNQLGDTTIRWYLQDFITKFRSITTDQRITGKNLDDAVAYAEEFVRPQIQKMIDEIAPWKLAAIFKRREVKFESILSQSNGVWEVQWTETTSSVSAGMEPSSERFRALIGLTFADITKYTEEERQKEPTPIGMHISSIDIQKLQSAN